jgi:N-acetylmuramoyl-L-alanine amidase
MPRYRAAALAALAVILAACSAPAQGVPAGSAAARPPGAGTLAGGDQEHGTAQGPLGRPAPRVATRGSAAPARVTVGGVAAGASADAARGTGPTAVAPRIPLPRIPTVVLDPGHNGANALHPEIINRLVPAGFGQVKPCNTTGTATAGGYAEHAFNWDVSLRVRALLVARGVRVLLTRPSDTGVGPCVNDRAAFGNAQQATAVVSIHADGHVGGSGFHVIEASRLPAGAATGAASHRLAVAVHDRYLASSGFATANYIGSGGYDRRSDLAGLNLSLRPTIFIECGNMFNSGDAGRMLAAAGRQRAAAAIAAGILAFLGR